MTRPDATTPSAPPGTTGDSTGPSAGLGAVSPALDRAVEALAREGKASPALALDAATAVAGVPDAAALARAVRREWFVTTDALAELGQGKPYALLYGGSFHVEQTLRYLGRDRENLAEVVEGNRYRRYFPAGNLPAKERQVPVTLTFERKGCRVEAGGRLSLSARLALHRSLVRFLGLDQSLSGFRRTAGKHPVMGPLVKKLGGVRVPQVPGLWEALCWAVIGQQINLAFAYRLRNRLIALGNRIEVPPHPAHAPPYPFPSPEQVLEIPGHAWRPAQYSRQKTAYLAGLAISFRDGVVSEEALRAMPDEAASAALLALKGLGPWSVAYGLLRALGRMDALPVGDAGLRASLKLHFGLPAMPGPREQEELMEPFRPYRGLATYYLWKALDRSRQE